MVHLCNLARTHWPWPQHVIPRPQHTLLQCLELHAKVNNSAEHAVAAAPLLRERGTALLERGNEVLVPRAVELEEQVPLFLIRRE